MNILFVLPQIVYGRHGGFVGGYVNSVINLMERMQHACQLTLVAGISQHSDTGEAELRDRLKHTRLCRVQMKNRPTTAPYFAEFTWKAPRICRGLRRTGVDFVYGHSGHPAYALTTRIAARAAGGRPIHAFYCPVSAEFQHRKMGLATRALVTLAFRSVPHTVAISAHVRDTILQFTRNKSAPVVIPPAIPDDFVPTAASHDSPQPDRPLVLGFVGHHKPEKGFDLALDAIRDSVNNGRPVLLQALTSGAESQGRATDEVTAMIEARGLGDKVRRVSGIKDIRDFYAQIDLMLIPFRGTRGPSDYPMVLLEAMSLGVPVVCTPVGAIPEVVKDGVNGFLSQDISSQAFSRVLSGALADFASRKAEIAAQALATAKRFRASEVNGATIQLFANLHSRSKV